MNTELCSDNKVSKVSILIPSYNQEEVIEQTLHSALSQTYENIEVIVSDDGSTDLTSQILNQWQQKFPQKLKIFLHKENLGVTKNHTRGLLECTGDFITFLDGDDIFLPEKIEKQLTFMLETPDCSISYHDVDTFDSLTGKQIYLWSKRFGTRQGTIRELVRFGNYLPAVSVMVRRKDLPPDGYDQRIAVYSDWFLWLCTLSNGRGKICYMDDILAKYRRHSGNLTNVSKWKFTDQNLVLDMVSEKWPELNFEIRMRRSEIHFMQAVNSLFQANYESSVKYFLSALQNGFPFLPWLRLIIREIFFFMKHRFYTDDILKSILFR